MKKGSFSITLYRKNSSKTGEAIIMRYKTFEAFQNNVLKTPVERIWYIGWSDGYNACGYGKRQWIFGDVKEGINLLFVPEATKKGYALAEVGDSIDFSFPTSKTRRGRVGKKAKNLMTSPNVGVVWKGYVRKLTPIECERLQGLPDNYTGGGTSDNQRYKMLGNAFNVDVVAHILSFIPKK